MYSYYGLLITMKIGTAWAGKRGCSHKGRLLSGPFFIDYFVEDNYLHFI